MLLDRLNVEAFRGIRNSLEIPLDASITVLLAANGTAKTSIAGTGYECAAAQGADSANSGSSTGWLMTEWPVEPGEEFWLTFHVHDTGDGIFDSEVILDGLQFVGAVTPGTWAIEPM